MREVHLRTVDLNLLHALHALLEERQRHPRRQTLLPNESEHWTGYAKHSEILFLFGQDAFMRGRRAGIQYSPRAVGQTQPGEL